MSDRERAIRDLAYRIWEDAGRPEGEGEAHWAEAQRRYAADHGAAPTPPARGKTSKRAADGPAKAPKGKAKDEKKTGAPAKTKAIARAAAHAEPGAAADPKAAKTSATKAKATSGSPKTKTRGGAKS